MAIDLYNINSYDYNLPKELIAQKPCIPADECKLLYSNGGKINDFIFKDILEIIDKDTIIFFNNSKVLKAKIPLSNNKIINKNLTEKIIKNGEIFFLKQENSFIFESLIYPGKKIQTGSKLFFENGIIFEIVGNTKEGRLIKSNKPILEILEQYGQMPLPPYIEYQKELENSYQPIFAQKYGSVASPTASLHFTKNLLNKLKEKGIGFEYLTLHIGIGTFKPVNVENIKDFDIHEEIIEINYEIFDKIANYKKYNKKILAVGTTSTRTLESLPYLWVKTKNSGIKITDNKETIDFWDSLTKGIELQKAQEIIKNINSLDFGFSLSTKIFIYPGFKFLLVDELITNFHLPKSSLLMLVAAFMGYDNMWKSYNHAISNGYKFFSFGDSMYIRN